MWGPGYWGGPMWGFGWIFPLVGLLVCLAFLVMAFRALRVGGGFMCMGHHHPSSDDDVAEMRREIRALRDEVKQLKAPR
ncbi:MAG: hypothetical protein HY216_14435 [Candidatus Rokubacteria bacterium]|nr:hypothetical protein [Candidatus Rokubacteria bacterium]